MNEIGLSCGVPIFIEEISQKRTSDQIGSSVCVTGKLVDHNVNKCLATLIDPGNKHEMNIDTTYIEPFEAKLASLYQMIGEIDILGLNDERIVLKTRVVRCVDGMDLTMYRKAVECQRTYLSKRNG